MLRGSKLSYLLFVCYFGFPFSSYADSCTSPSFLLFEFSLFEKFLNCMRTNCIDVFRRENVFTGLDGFPNNAQNSGDMPDVQDGYGLMISELLGAEFPNCSSVQGDINSMHNEMPLPNGEVLPCLYPTSSFIEDSSF